MLNYEMMLSQVIVKQIDEAGLSLTEAAAHIVARTQFWSFAALNSHSVIAVFSSLIKEKWFEKLVFYISSRCSSEAVKEPKLMRTGPLSSEKRNHQQVESFQV